MAKHTLTEIAQVAGATLAGDGSACVEGTASLRDATPRDVSFCSQPRYQAELASTRAGAVLVPHDLEVQRQDLALLRCQDVNRAFTKVCALFAAERPRPRPGVHPTAVVHPLARVGERVAIGAHSVVGEGAQLGDGVILHSGVHVGEQTRIGEGTEIHANVVLYPLITIGARCLVHGGAVIGADGFGFDPPSAPGGVWTKIPQSGTVVIEDDVEIGANCAIDRARFGATRIGRGAKLDNLIHVAHNVEVGQGAVLAAQVGIAGSSRIGRYAMIGGQVGVGGHLSVGDGARLGGQTGVTTSIPAGAEDWFGTPAARKRDALRQYVLIGRLQQLVDRVGELEARLAALQRSEQGAS